jgi:hypothetical protein
MKKLSSSRERGEDSIFCSFGSASKRNLGVVGEKGSFSIPSEK